MPFFLTIHTMLKLLPIMNKKTNRLHSSQKNAMLRARNREQIRSYFEQVLNLHNCGDPFPVDLDEVWPLVYSRKDNAVKVLERKFVKEEEYISKMIDNQRFRQKAESKTGGDFRTIQYKLSVGCMEFLIAREDTSIFAIYREVFHVFSKSLIPIAGVYPVLLQGKILYPYTPLLKAIGYSTRSGSVQSRRRQYPQHFVKYTDRNWITPEMANLLVQQRETIVLQEKLKHAQQFLPFKEDEV